MNPGPRGLRFVGDSIESFSEGDLVFIGPDVPHTWASSPEVKQVEAIVVQFVVAALTSGSNP